MTFLALPWFVLVTTGSPTRMGVVLAAELAADRDPRDPVSGAVIARFGARRTMIVGRPARAPLLAVDPAAARSSACSTFPLLLVLVALRRRLHRAVLRVAAARSCPSSWATTSTSVAQANAVVEGATRATALLGPAAAGLLIAAFGAPVVLYVDAATFLFSFVLLCALRPRSGRRCRSPTTAGASSPGSASCCATALLRVLGRHRARHERVRADARAPALTGARLRGVRRSSKVAGAFFAAFGLGAVARQRRGRADRRPPRPAPPRRVGVRRADAAASSRSSLDAAGPGGDGRARRCRRSSARWSTRR